MAAQLNQKNLSSLQIASFCTQLSLLIKAGISLQEGIHILYEDASSQAEKELLKQILEPIEEGQPLAFSLRQTDAFPQYMVEMVEIGETSGKLEEVLDSLTEYYERSKNISKSIRSAVTYPMIMILMMAVVIGVLMIKVLPIFRQVFSQLGTEMSNFSQSIMDFGSIVGIIASVVIGLILLLIIIALGFADDTFRSKNIVQYLLSSSGHQTIVPQNGFRPLCFGNGSDALQRTGY